VALALLLASNSPRRRKLLAQAGFDFVTVAPAITERFDPNLTLLELTAWNAVRKAISVARLYPEKVVIAADTLVAVDHEVLGKPTNRAEAFEMLRRLAGRGHEVCSAVFICCLAKGRSLGFQEISRVYFRRLTDTAIRRYIEKVNSLDKAGAYAAQGAGGAIIARIDGSHSNVVGLPMKQTKLALAKFGIRPRRPVQRRT
jgi:septum formation protein